MKFALLAMDLRRLVERYHCSLDGNRTAATHRIHERLAAVVTRHGENCRGERFLERRRMARLAITALVQRLARGVEARRHSMSVKRMHRPPKRSFRTRF